MGRNQGRDESRQARRRVRACPGVWDDPLHVILPDRIIDGEQRWHAIGVVGLVTVLVAVHTYPLLKDESHIRIIGARRATAHERKRYEEDNA